MNEIILNGKKYNAPSNWEEVSKDQFICWAAACLKKMEIGQIVHLFIQYYYSIPISKYLNIPESLRIQIAPTLSFLWGDKLPVKWIIKSIRIGLVNTYYGPEDRLANCTINEFRFLILYYQAYQKSQSDKEEFLDQLIATLYRPKRKDKITNDIREDLTDYGVRVRAKSMSKLSKKVRHAILLNFEGCYAFIKGEYLDKLPKGSSSDGLFDFNTIIRTVSGGKFGPKIQTEQTMLYDFLEHLIENAEEAERLKAR